MNITLTTTEISTILELISEAESTLEDLFTFSEDDERDVFEDQIKALTAIRTKLTEAK